MKLVQTTECISLSLLSFGSSLFSFSGSFLSSSFGLASHVKVETSMLSTDWSDKALLVQISDESSGNGTTDLEFFAKDGSGDAENLWNLLNHSLVLLLVEENSVVKLFLYLNLGP